MKFASRVDALLDGMHATDAERAAVAVWLLNIEWANAPDDSYTAQCLKCGTRAWFVVREYFDVTQLSGAIRTRSGLWVCGECWDWRAAMPSHWRTKERGPAHARAVIGAVLRDHAAKVRP